MLIARDFSRGRIVKLAANNRFNGLFLKFAGVETLLLKNDYDIQ